MIVAHGTIERLLTPMFIVLVIAGCGSGSTAPSPDHNRCFYQYTRYSPGCEPWTPVPDEMLTAHQPVNVSTPMATPTTFAVVASIIPVTQIVMVTQAVEAPTITTMPTKVRVIPAPDSPHNLLVWYDFEGDFSGSGIVVDQSGNRHDARVMGIVSAANGISGGQAISFTGESFAQAQSNPAAGISSVTFSLWFKTEHPESNYKLASAAWWNGGPGSGWIMATHIPEFWSEDTNSLYLPDIINNDNHFPANEWVHEVVAYDGTHIKEYTNGQMINDWPTTGAGIGQGEAMIIGAWLPFSAYNFQGSIDEFQIFDYALSWEEVQALYNQK